MLTALPVGTIDEYTPEPDRQAEIKTFFLLAVPTDEQDTEIRTLMEVRVDARGERHYPLAQSVRGSLLRCLRGWGNFPDKEGRPVEYAKALGPKTTPWEGREKALDWIDWPTKLELFNRILDLGAGSPEKKG